MCYFLTLGMPETLALAWSVPRGLALGRCDVNCMLSELPRGYQTYFLTTGGCSCALYSRPEPRPDNSGRDERLRAKYAKMRWSKSRIERAIQQADHKLPHEEFFGLRPDVVRLVSEMAEKDGD